ncbi:MAG: hypothetical protein Q7S06_01040 [Nanoarchaeota archaeon]|nr:hypothetical protein [Nanoarchaeota archaeon]
MGLVGKIAKGTGLSVLALAIGLYLTGYIWNTVDEAKINRKLKEVKYELDVDRDTKLSQEEIRTFFDKTGISPYTEKSLKSLSLEELQSFNRQYGKQ